MEFEMRSSEEIQSLIDNATVVNPLLLAAALEQQRSRIAGLEEENKKLFLKTRVLDSPDWSERRPPHLHWSKR